MPSGDTDARRKIMSGPRYQIILVEDAEPDVFLVREALEQSGIDFDLKVFDDGEQGLQFVETMDRDATATPPHLFLLDLNLPKKTGGQILRHVRQSHTCGHIPVVILTSSDSHKDKAEATDLHATGYFRKPSRLEEFMKLGPYVRELLTHSRQGESDSSSVAV